MIWQCRWAARGGGGVLRVCHRLDKLCDCVCEVALHVTHFGAQLHKVRVLLAFQLVGELLELRMQRRGLRSRTNSVERCCSAERQLQRGIAAHLHLGNEFGLASVDVGKLEKFMIWFGTEKKLKKKKKMIGYFYKEVL